MQPIVTDRIAWCVSLSVCLSFSWSVSPSVIMSPAEMYEPIEIRLECGLRWVRCHLVVDSGGPEEACIRWGAHWRLLENMIEPSMCGISAALCYLIAMIIWFSSKLVLTVGTGIRRELAKGTSAFPFRSLAVDELFYARFSGTTRVNQCQKRTSGLYGAREDWQRQRTNHPVERHSVRTKQCPLTPSPHFLPAGCPICCPTNRVNVKALKATSTFGLGKRH